VARWAGVKVLTFSLGFGPELAGFNDRHGTRLEDFGRPPLGGYVSSSATTARPPRHRPEALAGMTEEERAGSFPPTRRFGTRAAIVAAGPIANFLLAFVIFTCLFTFFGKPSTTARFDQVEAGSARRAAAFRSATWVTAIDATRSEVLPTCSGLSAFEPASS